MYIFEAYLRRFYPDRWSEVRDVIATENLSQHEMKQLAHSPGVLETFIRTRNGIRDVPFHPPCICNIENLQAQVDGENSVRLEEESRTAVPPSASATQLVERVTSSMVAQAPPVAHVNPVLSTIAAEDGNVRSVGSTTGTSVSSTRPAIEELREDNTLRALQALQRAVIRNERVVLSQLHGAPEAYEGMTVEPYLPESDPPTSPSVLFEIPSYDEAAATTNDNVRAVGLFEYVIIPYLQQYYPMATHIISSLLQYRPYGDLMQLCRAPYQLERLILSLRIKTFTPIPHDAMEYVDKFEDIKVVLDMVLIQGSPNQFMSLFQEWAETISPPHAQNGYNVTVVQPNLTEAKPTRVEGKQKIRIQLSCTFDFREFLGISPATSALKTKWEDITRDRISDLNIITLYNAREMRIAAYLPMLIPEHSFEGVKGTIMSRSHSLEYDQFHIDWQSFTSDGNTSSMAVVVSDKRAGSLVRNAVVGQPIMRGSTE